MLAPDRFTASGGYGAEVSDQVSSDKVLAEFAAGATIVLQGLHRMWPPLVDFTRRARRGARAPRAGQRVRHAAVVAGVLPALRHPRRVRPADLRREALGHPRARAPGPAQGPGVDRPPRGRRRRRPRDARHRPGPAPRRRAVPAARLDPLRDRARRHVHPPDGRAVGVHPRRRRRHAARLVGDSAALRASLPLGIDVSDPDQLRPIVEETVADLVAALTATRRPGEPDRTTPRRPVRPRHPPRTGRPAGHPRRDHRADRAHPRPVAQRLRRPHRDGGRPRAADRPGHGADAARSRPSAGPATAPAHRRRPSPSGRSPASTWPARSSSSAACCARAWW